MARLSKSTKFFDFTGGLNTKSPVTSLAMNQAMDLQNINILPSGGFEKRRGNTAFNSSAMVGSTTAVTGLGYYKTAAGVEYMMAIAGTKAFKADNLDGTMDDITGAVTITTGTNNIWTHTNFNDLSIFVGGAPDAPIRWNATGNMTALAGSPPSGSFGFSANNRMFIGGTTANPSRIYWSILGNPEDWTGTGSGSQDVQLNDGDTLVGAAVMGIDHALLFKQNSIHDLAIRTSPFPLFPLFSNVGAISKRGIVVVDGVAYFITPEPRMKATDGTNIIEFPDTIDDIWDSLVISRLPYIHGMYYRRLHQIWWFVTTTGSTHDLCIVWDLKRKCWLKHPTGFKMNCSAMIQNRLAYAGGYDGKIYLQDAASTYVDNSETTTAINAYWRSGWMDFGTTIETKNVPYSVLCYTTQVSGTFNYSYGYDFNQDQSSSDPISMQASGSVWDSFLWDVGAWGTNSDATSLVNMAGNGKFFQHAVRNGNSGEPFMFNGIEIPIEQNAPHF